MTIQVQDVPAPVRANARSLKATADKIGGEGREKSVRFEVLLSEAVRDRTIDLSDVKLEEVAHLAMGPAWRQKLLEGRGRDVQDVQVYEAGQPVTSDFFDAVTGQVIYSQIRQSAELPDFYFSRAIPVMQSGLPGVETVPEITPPGDVAEDVAQGQEYPSVGIGAANYTLPASAKKGLKIEVTEETLSFTAPQGLTASILAQSGMIGRYLGYKREISLIDVVIGFVNNYIRNGVGLNTYLTAGAYVNNQTGAALVDHTDVDSAEQLLAEIPHPDTGLPMAMMGGRRTMIVMPSNLLTARRIVNATEVRSGDITTGAGIQVASGNPLAQTPIDIVASMILYQRVLATVESEAAKARAGWFYGYMEAFGWKELWPLAVFQQGAESNAGFERDVVRRWKARYHGVAFVKEPRLITRNEDSAWA